MKYFTVLFTALFFLACSPKPYAGIASNAQEDQSVYATNFQGSSEERLALMLRKNSGVLVSQTGTDYVVRVRGISSLGGDSNPLYVIDGTAIGHNFRSAAEVVASKEINSVRVLKGTEASIYGVRGSNGVIQIRTKKTKASN